MVSLMEDQIIQLKNLDINAKMISSYSSKEDVKLLFQVLILLLFIYIFYLIKKIDLEINILFFR